MRRSPFPAQRKSAAIAPWYERDGGQRLRQDQTAIAEAYPCLTFRIDEAKGICTLTGEMVHRAVCGVPTPIALQIKFPWSYPSREPLVYEVAKRFEHIPDRHFFDDGRCCLWLSEESRWNPASPEGLKEFLDEVLVFFDRQIVYDALPEGKKKWPGPERGHGVKGYWEYAVEVVGGDEPLLRTALPMVVEGLGKVRNRQCPCGSGEKVKRCHLHVLEALSRRLSRGKLCAVAKYATQNNEL